MTNPTEILGAIHNHVLEGDVELAVASTQEGLDVGVSPIKLVYEAMIPALAEVGRRFEVGDYFLPEMLVAAAAMQASMEIVRPRLAEAEAEPIASFVMGTVAGDIHDIGKNLCNVMLESGGFRVIDLGVNVAPESFVAAIREHQPRAVGMSAFVTTTMPEIERTIQAIDEAGLRDQVMIMVGGAPLDQDYADQVGADGFAPDANSAVRVTKRLLSVD